MPCKLVVGDLEELVDRRLNKHRLLPVGQHRAPLRDAVRVEDRTTPNRRVKPLSARMADGVEGTRTTWYLLSSVGTVLIEHLQ